VRQPKLVTLRKDIKMIFDCVVRHVITLSADGFVRVRGPPRVIDKSLASVFWLKNFLVSIMQLLDLEHIAEVLRS
jgi:hypothetical protein